MDYYHDEHYRLIREHTIAEDCHGRTENIGFSDFQRNRIVYALLFEALGILLLFLKQNDPGFLISILGVVFITIALAVVYNRILTRNRK